MGSRFIRRANIMSAVTIGAYRGIEFTFLGNLGVDAVESFRIIARMALLAGEVESSGKFAPVLIFQCGVRNGGDIRMAGLAFDPRFIMDGVCVTLW